MKTIGIVGGIGPESTIEYYRLIIASYVERIPDGSYPSIIINSIDLKKLLDMVAANERAKMTEFLVGEIQRLARAGAECGLVAANTPHIVFDEVRRQSSIPLISIVEATCEAAKALGLRKLGLFGTRFTMQGRFYPDVFSKEGITLQTVTKRTCDSEARAMFRVPEHRFCVLETKSSGVKGEHRKAVQAGASAAANRGRPRTFIIRFRL
jgi:aspartate racemase